MKSTFKVFESSFCCSRGKSVGSGVCSSGMHGCCCGIDCAWEPVASRRDLLFGLCALRTSVGPGTQWKQLSDSGGNHRLSQFLCGKS